MKKIAHILKPNAARKLPKWVIFYDTETREEQIDPKTKRLVLKLGYATLTRRNRHNQLTPVSSLVFNTPEEFNEWLDALLHGRERFYLVAHNIGFDIRVTGTLDYLAANAFKRTLLIDDNINFIAVFRRNDTTLKIINNQQLFNTSLRKLGEGIGVIKGEVDFHTVDDKTLLKYCKQDVEIMVQAWNIWIAFVADNDLGNFQITAASQSFSSFRHRFMKTPIYIHNHDKAIALERESYHGGRVECFFIGEYTKGQVYCYDVNSMYPAVMKQNKVPVKLLKYYDNISIKQFKKLSKTYAYVAELSLTLDEPSLPVVREGRLLFPTGEVRGVFTKPELEAAGSSARVRGVSRCAFYLEESVFSDFVDFFYGARLRFKEAKNDAFAYVSKIFMNSLYGKFAQKQLEYNKVGFSKGMLDGYYNMAWNGGQEYCKVRVINGVIEKTDGFKEGFNSFVAIASYITAYARAALWEYIKAAGIENVLYCDTDSLFVNEIGSARLASYIHPTALGKLKLEGVEEGITIRAPKWYKFGKKNVSKGIRANALELSPDRFEQDKFVSFRGSIRAHNAQGVVVKRVIKYLNPHYRKGVVLESGRVVPHHLKPEDVGLPL